MLMTLLMRRVIVSVRKNKGEIMKKLTEKELSDLEGMIEEINEIIERYHGTKIAETERDDLCNIRWMLENKLNQVVCVNDGVNIWTESKKEC